MAKELVVSSPYPNLRGRYTERGTNDGRPAFARDAQKDGLVTWIFFSTKFGKGSCWYFGRNLPQSGSLSSLCCSSDTAASPESAQWPSEDIISVKLAGELDGDVSSGPAAAQQATAEVLDTVMTPECAACGDLDTLVSGMLCSTCSPSADSNARYALTLLKDRASSTARKQLASAMAKGDAGAILRLEEVLAAHRSKDASPLILTDLPASTGIGAGTLALSCEAFCFSDAKVSYQWTMNGVPLPRAERCRLMLCGPKDMGSYACIVSAGSNSVTTGTCEVKLSVAEAANRARYESPLRRAMEAERNGNVIAAIDLLSQGIRAAEGLDSISANALCRRAELYNQLGRWQDAFNDASEAVKASGGLARAHAARGMAAVKLNLLAEAAISWETAELLGGVAEAASEAEKCRQRLDEFFEKARAGRDANIRGDGEDGKEGPEASWRQSGWNGRYTGGSAGDYMGGGGQGHGHGSGSGGYSSTVSAAMQAHLSVLGLALDARGSLPTAAAVRASYRKLALQAHPDKPGGSKTAFQALQNAYEALLGAVSG